MRDVLAVCYHRGIPALNKLDLEKIYKNPDIRIVLVVCWDRRNCRLMLDKVAKDLAGKHDFNILSPNHALYLKRTNNDRCMFKFITYEDEESVYGIDKRYSVYYRQTDADLALDEIDE